MAFEGLTQRLQQAFGKVRGKGSLTEDDVKLVMREVRMALLEADVNYKVVKDFVKKATERCVGLEMQNGLNAQQQVIKDGKRAIDLPSLDEIRSFVNKQLSTEIWQEEQRFENPHVHYLDMSPDYYDMKMSLLHDSRNE